MNIYKRTKNLVYTSPETANNEFDLTDNFTEIAQRNIENVSKKNGNLDIMLVYHQFNDEKEVAKAAEKETVEKLRKQNKSVEVGKQTFIRRPKGPVAALHGLSALFRNGYQVPPLILLVYLPQHIAALLHGAEGDSHSGGRKPKPPSQFPLGELLSLAVCMIESE